MRKKVGVWLIPFERCGIIVPEIEETTIKGIEGRSVEIVRTSYLFLVWHISAEPVVKLCRQAMAPAADVKNEPLSSH